MRLLSIIMFLILKSTAGYSQDASAIFSQAERKFASSNYEEAINLYTQVIEIDSENMNAYLRRGFSHSILKNYDASIDDYSHVIEVYPEHSFAYLSRGSSFNKKEEWQSALSDFDKVLELDPKNQEAYNNRGWAKVGLGLFKEACKDWKTSRKLGNQEAKIILKNNGCK